MSIHKGVRAKKSKPETRRARLPKIIYVRIVYVHISRDPYDNLIGGPNDYAYGM
jgi:hypothetical protein